MTEKLWWQRSPEEVAQTIREIDDTCYAANPATSSLGLRLELVRANMEAERREKLK